MIYNCMLFLNENDVLEIKINNHWDIIDKFIIIESSQTHTGYPKPFNFDQKRFNKYGDKIKYIQVSNLDELITTRPELVCQILTKEHNNNSNEITDDWIRDSVQSALLPLEIIELGGQDDDIVIIDCCDEIVSTQALEIALTRFNNKEKYTKQLNNNKIIIDPIFGFKFHNFYYKINLQNPHGKTIIQSMCTTLANLKTYKPSTLRHFGIHTHEPIEGGWHFGFLDNGEGQMALEKFKSWAHSRDKNTDYYNSVVTNKDAVSRLFSIFNLEKVPISIDSHPPFLVNNLDKYQYLIYDK